MATIKTREPRAEGPKLDQAVYGSLQYLGTIIASTTTTTNATTAAPFLIPIGSMLNIHVDADCYIGTSASPVLTSANGYPMYAKGTMTVLIGSATDVIQIQAVTGSVNVKVFLAA